MINGTEIVLVTDMVLVETICTLNGKKYSLGNADLVSVIRALFKEPNIRFENGQVVWVALNDFRNAKRVKGGQLGDFSDALIVNKAKHIASNLSVALAGDYTFDVAAQQLPGMKAPSHLRYLYEIVSKNLISKRHRQTFSCTSILGC